MEASNTVLSLQVEACGKPRVGFLRSIQDRLQYPIHALGLAVSISLWFLAIRAPLWLDETVSFFLIKGGLREILARQGWPDVPVYYYILWLWTKAVGTGEVTLRISSTLAMAGAVYLLYRAARELFDRDVAMIAAVVFCLHPVIAFASIDVRPYAFAALAICSSILALVHLRRNYSNWLAALFGLSAASILYFQVLYVVILPALAICFFALKIGQRKLLWWQLGVGFGAFALAFLPVIPGLLYMFNTSGAHAFSDPPKLEDLRSTLVLGKWPAFILAGTVLIAAATQRLDLKRHFEAWSILLCASLALVPAVLLYGVSVGTSVHIFVGRYRLVAVPGIALCWALVASRVNSRALRLLFCIAVVTATAYHDFRSPYSRIHGYTWKYALASVEMNASADNAPVLICSDLPESDQMPMPVGAAVKDSAIFAPLTYYTLSGPVMGLPRTLNAETIRVGSRFLQQAALQHERFLALGFTPSYGTLEWIAETTAETHYVRELGVFDGIKMLEFKPRSQTAASR